METTVEQDVRGTFTTPVTFEMVWKTAWAWATGRTIIHNGVKITRKPAGIPETELRELLKTDLE